VQFCTTIIFASGLVHLIKFVAIIPIYDSGATNKDSQKYG